MKRKDTRLWRLQGGCVHCSPRLSTGCSLTVLSLSQPSLLLCVLPPLKYTHRRVTAICPQIRICGILKPPNGTPCVTHCTSRTRAPVLLPPQLPFLPVSIIVEELAFSGVRGPKYLLPQVPRDRERACPLALVP